MRYFRICTAVCIALLITGTVFGAEKSGQFSISPMVGSYSFGGNIFHDSSTTSFVSTIRASYNLIDYIGLESNFAYSETQRSNIHQSFFKYGGDVLIHLMPGGDFVPFLAIGGGGFNFKGTNPGVSTAIQSYIGGGCGIKYSLHENIALRMDGRINHVTSQTDQKQVEFTVGLQFPFGGSRPVRKKSEIAASEAIQQPKAVPTGTASSNTPSSIAPSVMVTMPLGAAVSLTIPPLPAQNMTVTITSTAPRADDAAEPTGQPASDMIPVPSPAELAMPAAPVHRTVIKNIVIGKNYIDILANGPLPAYKTFQLTGPERLSIDLPLATNSLSNKTIHVNRFGVSNIRIGSDPDSVRIVLDTNKIVFPRYRIEKIGNNLRIHFTSKPSPKVRAKHAPKTLK
jgi:hypothetical protein